jgi:hypothetical protein
VDDVEGVLPPIRLDVVFAQSGGKYLVARVIQANTEGLEYLDAGGGVSGRRSERGRRWTKCGRIGIGVE